GDGSVGRRVRVCGGGPAGNLGRGPRWDMDGRRSGKYFFGAAGFGRRPNDQPTVRCWNVYGRRWGWPGNDGGQEPQLRVLRGNGGKRQERCAADAGDKCGRNGSRVGISAGG